ncbi:MAG: TIGR01777 family oxidoreductase [Micromonosporaceae bacterium]
MRVVMAGSSGFLGTRVTERLRRNGDQVVRLVRRPARADDEVAWDPASRQLDPEALSGADAVINLCGVGIGDRRWSAAYQAKIRSSRLDPTSTLSVAAAQASPRPRVLLNASGIAWYGDTGDHAVEEGAPPGAGFLPELAQEWEAATAPASDAGIRVVTVRSGLVLAGSGGLLARLGPIFRWGVGGPLGSGRQYMSWISLADWIGAVTFLLDQEREAVRGPVNLTAPHPETNAEFTRALGKAVRRPAVLPVPKLAIQILQGDFADEVMSSQRVLPGVLTRAGYRFEHPEVGPALRWALKH